MKSLHLDSERTWRGGEQQLVCTVQGLVARGLPAAILAQPDSPLLERARAAGLDARAFSMRSELDFAAARRLRRLLREETFDILHCHTPHAHAIALASVWRLPASARPKLVVSRRVDFAVRRRGDLFGLSPLKYNLADRILAVSEAVRRVLIRDGVAAEKVVCVREGIDVARIEQAPARKAEIRQSLGLREGERLIGNVAALTAHKGQCYLLEAIPAIRAAHPNARVVIFGAGELRQELEGQARALGLGDALILAGFRSPDEIPSILKALDLFVLSSVEEGLGTSLFDAMAAGAPIVATRAGGIPEIVRDPETGLLVEPRNVQALADAVIRLLSDAPLATRLAEAARSFVQREGTKERMVEETIQAYAGVLGREQPRL